MRVELLSIDKPYAVNCCSHEHSTDLFCIMGRRMLRCAVALLGYAAAYETLTEDEVIRRVNGRLVDALVDLRTPEEWEVGHLPHAYFVRFDSNATEPFNVSSLSGCEHCRVITYCHSGYRAGVGAGMLEHAGFTSVADGLGVEQWTAAGQALVKTPSTKPTCIGTGKCAPIPVESL